MYKNDKDLFLTLLDAAMKFEAEENDAENEDSTPKRYVMDPAEFIFALQLGRFDILSEIMRRTGTGIPFDQLVKNSGVSMPEKKSPYYQGLSIRGEKKKAWARAYTPSEGYSSESKPTPPLLLAAFNGSLESVEWLFSDAPLRLYKEYVESNKQYPEVEAFSKLPGGAERAISQWLDTRSKF
jgi:hypothetical protein